MIRKITAAFLFLFTLCLAMLSVNAGNFESSALTIFLPDTVKGYTFCTVTVQSPAAGEAELRLYDSLENPWLIRRETLSAGENLLTWDGLGANRERLMSGPYRMDVVLYTEDGAEQAASGSSIR